MQDTFVPFTQALAAVTSAFRTHLRQRFKEHSLDITFEMIQVLRYLWEHDGVNQQEIACAVGKDKASMTALLDNLARRELITRCEDPQDRRSKRIVLTVQGRQMEQIIMPWIEEMFATATSGIPPLQLLSVISTLERMAVNFTPVPA